MLKTRKNNAIKIIIRHGKQIFDNFKIYVGRLTNVFDVSELVTRLKKNLSGMIKPPSRSNPTNQKSTRR